LLKTKNQTNNGIYKDQQNGLFSEMHDSAYFCTANQTLVQCLLVLVT